MKIHIGFHALLGFDRMFFCGFATLDDFSYGFTVSNAPHCPLYVKNQEF